MQSSTNGASSPGVNAQNTSYELLVALMGGEDDAVTQKKRAAQKDSDQKFLEQDLANAVQEIITGSSDDTSAIARIKRFLEQMDTAAPASKTELKAWINDELNDVNSYKGPDQDEIDKLNQDVRQLNNDTYQLNKDTQGLAASESALGDCQNADNANEDNLNNLITQDNKDIQTLREQPWRVDLAFAIAGLSVAIDVVEIACLKTRHDVDMMQDNVNHDEDAIKNDKNAISNDQNNIHHDNLKNNREAVKYLKEASSSNDLLNSICGEELTSDKALQKSIEADLKLFEGIKFGNTDNK